MKNLIIAIALLGTFSAQAQQQQAQQVDTAKRYVTYDQLAQLQQYIVTLPYKEAAPIMQWLGVVAQQTDKADKPKK